MMNNNSRVPYKFFALLFAVTVTLIGTIWFTEIKLREDNDAMLSARTDKLENSIDSVNDKLASMKINVALICQALKIKCKD